MHPVYDYEHTQYDCVLALGTPVLFAHPELTPIRRDEIYVHQSRIRRFNGSLDIKLGMHTAICSGLALQFPQYRQFIRHTDGVMHSVDLTIQAGYAAIHDDTECILNDVVSGLKRILRDYQALEHTWEPYVHKAQGMPLEHRNNQLVKAVDMTSLALEMMIGGHPVGPYAVKKYGVLYEPAMLDFARWIIHDLTDEERWFITQETYLAGKILLGERLDEQSRFSREEGKGAAR